MATLANPPHQPEGNNYWNHVWTIVHKGRLKKVDRTRLEEALKIAEKRGHKAVKAVD